MREARLGDVVTSMKNGMYKPASEYIEDGIACLRMYNIEAGTIVWRDVKRMRVSERELSDYGLREGDLLVNRVNSRDLVGKAACIPPSLEPSVFESKNIRVRLDTSKVLPKFINYQLLAGGNRHFANNAQQVVGMASINQGQLADFPIVLADLDEQGGIVREIEMQFSRLDEAVANLKRTKANLGRYKRAVLKSAMDGNLVDTEDSIANLKGVKYETSANLLARVSLRRRERWTGRGSYKEAVRAEATTLPPLPQGWMWASVDELASKVTDGVHKKPNYTAAGIPFVTVKNLTAGPGISFDNLNYVSEADHAEYCKRTKPERGDILISKDGTLGVVRLVETDREFSVFVSVALVKPVLSELGRFLAIAFQSPQVQKQMVPKGSGLQHIHLEDLRADCIPVPPLPEQARIVAEVERRLSIVGELEAEVEANLKRAQSLRQAILSKAFSGARARFG